MGPRPKTNKATDGAGACISLREDVKLMYRKVVVHMWFCMCGYAVNRTHFSDRTSSKEKENSFLAMERHPRKNKALMYLPREVFMYAWLEIKWHMLTAKRTENMLEK